MKLSFQTFIHYLRKKLPIIVLVILLFVFGISQYRTRVMYETYISNKMNSDLHDLIIWIIENNWIYEAVLKSGKISKQQMGALMWGNEEIEKMIAEYRVLAVDLNKRKEEFRYDKTVKNAHKISGVFVYWLITREISGKEIKLDSKEKLKVRKMYELNSKWKSAVDKYRGINFSLSDLSWIKLIENIENGTIAFLRENNIESFDDIWFERTKIK